MSNDLYSKNIIQSKKVSEILKQISSTELSKQLGFADNRMVNNACKKVLPNKAIENGITTYFTEEEATMIISYIKKQSNRTDLETLHTSLKGVQTSKTEEFEMLLLQKQQQEIQKKLDAYRDRRIAELTQENQQLKSDNEILVKQKSARDNIVADKCDNQKLFADLNKAIRKYAILNNIANPVAYRYFYDKLCDIHCFTDKLTMEKLKKYPKYAKELLDIVLSELKC